MDNPSLPHVPAALPSPEGSIVPPHEVIRENLTERGGDARCAPETSTSIVPPHEVLLVAATSLTIGLLLGLAIGAILGNNVKR